MRTLLTLTLLVLLAVSFTGCQRGSAATATKPVEVATATPTPKAVHYCNALTKKGTPCQHRVKADGDRCFMHQGKPPAPGYK